MSRRGWLVALAATAAVAALLELRMRQGADDARDEPVSEPAPLARLTTWQPAAPRSAAGRWAAYAWAGPNSLGGLLLGATTRTRPRVMHGALVFTPAGGPVAALLRSRGYRATTLGHVVVSVAEPTPALLTHELCHSRQAERLGPVFAPAYLALLAVYGYRRHPVERAARRAAQGSSPSSERSSASS